jgi:hypothetical protein
MTTLMTTLMTALFFGCHAGVSGNGNVITKSIEVGAFKNVAIGSGIHGHVRQGPRAVTLETDENLAQYVLVAVEGETLKATLTPGVLLVNQHALKLNVSNDAIESVEASGGAEVDAEATQPATLSLAASGGGRLVVSGIQVSELRLSATGGSRVKLVGTATTGDLTVSGGSNADLEKLDLLVGGFSVSGGSKVTSKVRGSVSGAASGGARVKLLGSPKGEIKVSGGSAVDR